ncbi:MAG TPA: DegQ family serine endoprotease [Candidatus Binatia bacterium]|nr:DegQ family serine endoprotease [Candidatus Binatia bacterium]
MRQILGNLPFKARLALLGGATLLIGSTLAFSKLAENETAKAPPVRLVVDEAPVKRDGHFTTSFAPVVKKITPAVVNVFTTTAPKKQKLQNYQNPLFDDPFFRRFFGDGSSEGQPREFRTPKQHGLGSGVVVSEDGYILTNNHVVDNADEIKVAFADGKEYTAKVVGRDDKSDIAVLKIDAKSLPYAHLANTDNIEVGDVVLAIGNPFGVGQTVTTGIISATGRANMGLDYEDFIQTDAAINPGNSGGALIDAEGRLIGINTAILSRSGGNQGIGFAIPMNLVRYVMESIIKDGRVIRGFMGVNIQDVTPNLAKEFNIKENSGALVADVTPDSPAAKAGLKAGDIITQFDGKPVRDSRHLKLQVAQIAPNSKVPVQLMRDGSTKTFEVRLKEFPKNELASKSSRNRGNDDNAEETLKGVAVGDIDVRSREQLKLPSNMKGALVTGVDDSSASYEAGLREGDVILEINRKPVTGAEDAVELSNKADKKGSVLLRVWSRGGTRYLVVKEGKES